MSNRPLPAISQSIWEDKYRHKEQDGTPIDADIPASWRRVATALSRPEATEESRSYWEDRFFDIMDSGHFSPAGRIIAGAGTDRSVTLSNCFTMGTIPDSMSGIFDMLKEAALTMQAGGGIGYDFSTIRPRGAAVVGVASDASGPLSFMDVWDSMCRTIMSAGTRRGAMMATMNVGHPDIMDFITAKGDAARLRMFNMSVLITNKFMDAVKANTEWTTEFKGVKGKTYRARTLWDAIMQATYDYAEPGVIFIDRVNYDHNLNYIETIATTNPCGEKPMGPYASCLLGSLNLAMFVDDPYKTLSVNSFAENPEPPVDLANLNKAKLVETVATAIRMMDNVVDAGQFPLPAQAEKAKADRQLGLGITGYADALIMLGMVYGSDEAEAWTDRLMEAIAIAAYEASCDLAEEKGAFPSFDADGFLGEGTFAQRMLPEHLQNRIRKTGIRNALLLSIAPTGTISLFARNVSSGIEPVFGAAYTRKRLMKDGSRVPERVVDYAMDVWDQHTTVRWTDQYGDESATGSIPSSVPPAFVSTVDLMPEDHIRMQSVVQKWVDSSISKTVNLPEDISFEDFKAVYMLAWDSGCKGCTTYRPNEITGSVLSLEPTKVNLDEPLPDETLPEDSYKFSDTTEFATAYEIIYNALACDLGKEQADAHAATCWEAYALGNTSIWDVPHRMRENFINCLSEYPMPMNDLEAVVMIAEPEDPLTEIFAKAQKFTNGGPVGRKIDTPAVVATSHGPEAVAPPKRPVELQGTTYKLKLGDEQAIYLVVNDINDSGTLRVFEVFINSKNVAHTAWISALTLTLSAIFRRPGSARFIVDELRGIADPAGGGWSEGKRYDSIVAMVANKLAHHMDQLDLRNSLARDAGVRCEDSEVPRAESFMPGSFANVETARLKRALEAKYPIQYVDAPPEPTLLKTTLTGEKCTNPKCLEFAVIYTGGCKLCSACGDSTCG